MNAPQNRHRVAAGTPSGGQFAPENRPRSVVTLDDARPALDIPAVAKGRRQLLNSMGYVAPKFTDAAVDPRTAADRERWWNYNFRAAEYGHTDGDYPQMPDDNTPSMTDGESLSGRRRTHRMAYSGSGVTLRMPSVAAIKRFAGQSRRKTFDVPVSAIAPSGTAQGWVRVTQGGDGQWAAEPLGFTDRETAAYVSESVASVLEARRPTRALAEAGSLLAKFKDRRATVGGAVMEQANSSWISALGYDRQNNTMVMTTGGRKYGYAVPHSTFQAVATATRPGAVYNQLVRNKTERVPVAECGKCYRFYNEAVGVHRCPPRPAGRDGTMDVQNARARARARDL